MKKKNISVLRNRGQNAHYFGNTQAEIYAQNFGFFEGRLLNQTAPPEGGPDTVGEEASPGRKNTIAMLEAVRNLKDTGVLDVDDIPGSEKPDDFLKDNPFQHFLYGNMQLCDVKAGDLTLNGTKNDRANGVFILHFSSDSVRPEHRIDGDAYIALMWQKIGPLVKEKFARQITNPATLNALMTKAVEHNKPSFMAMVKAMATSQNPDTLNKLVAKALTELQALDPEARRKFRANADAAKKLEGLRGSPGFEEANKQFQQAEKIRKQNEQFDQIDKIRKQMEHLEKNMSGNLAYLRMSVAGGSEEIDPKRWDCTTQPGIAEIQKDWRTLGIYAQSPAEFLDDVIFANLRKSADPNLRGEQSPEKQQIYLNPLANIDKLDQLGDPVFAESVKFFAKMKEIAEQQDQYRKNQTENHQQYGEEPITATLGKAMRDNGKAFMDALHNKDLTTAGAYVLGVWAIYRAYKSLPPDKQDKYSTWAFRGAAIYAAHIFAKNAGYNVLEKLGIKDLGYELANTSLDVLYEVLPELKNVPPRVINATAMTNIGDLYKNYKKTNAEGKRQWIDPAKFRTEFPEFARMRPNDAFKDKNLNSKEKDYKDTGHQLYALVGGLEAAYNRIMKPHDSKNFLSFEDAFLKDATLSKSTILAFTIALRNYNVEDHSAIKLLGAREISNLSRRLHKVFDKQDMGVNLESGMRDDHAINGTIMNFPVVFKRNTRDKKMLIVPRYVYEEKNGSFDPMFDVIGKIPLEDIEVDEGLEESKPVSAEAAASITAMKQKFVDTMRRNTKGIFRTDGGFLVDPQWKGGRWQAKMSFNRRLTKGAIEQPIDVEVIPTNNGKGLMVVSTDPDKRSILLNIQNLTDDTEVFGSTRLSELVSQRSAGRAGVPDFTPLSWFNHNNKLRFRDGDPKDDFFEIAIDKVRIDNKDFIKIKMMPDGTFIFADTGMEKKLLEHPGFQVELSGAIADVEFKDLTKQWNDTIEATPQDFLFHFAGLFPNAVRKGTWDKMLRGVEAKFLTGSVPKNFTKALVKAQMSAIQAKFRLGMETADSLGKVDELRSSIMMGGKAGMANALEELQRMNRENEEEGKEFSEAGFQAVWENLIGATHKSNDYKGFYRAFMDKVFARYGIDDFSEGDALKASRLLEVFSYYTAGADNPDMDGANLNFELRVTPTVKKHMEIIDGLDKEREKAKQPKATYAELATRFPLAGSPGMSSAMTKDEFDDARKVLTEHMKLQAYNQNASYCGAVANAILNRLSAEIKDGMPPGPSGGWGMPKYEEYLESVPNGPNELVDASKVLKMSRDYVTIDKWLEKTPTERTALGWKEEDVILPRTAGSLILNFKNKDDFKFYLTIWNEFATKRNKFEHPRMTQLEDLFVKKVEEKVKKLREVYESEMLPSFDQTIMTEMMVGFKDSKNIDGSPLNPAMIYAGSFPTKIQWDGPLSGPSTGIVASKKPTTTSAMSEKIALIEHALGSRTTITGTQQIAIVDKYVQQYFEHRILGEHTYHEFFYKKSAGESFMEWLRGVKVWLFGRS